MNSSSLIIKSLKQFTKESYYPLFKKILLDIFNNENLEKKEVHPTEPVESRTPESFWKALTSTFFQKDSCYFFEGTPAPVIMVKYLRKFAANILSRIFFLSKKYRHSPSRILDTYIKECEEIIASRHLAPNEKKRKTRPRTLAITNHYGRGKINIFIEENDDKASRIKYKKGDFCDAFIISNMLSENHHQKYNNDKWRKNFPDVKKKTRNLTNLDLYYLSTQSGTETRKKTKSNIRCRTEAASPRFMPLHTDVYSEKRGKKNVNILPLLYVNTPRENRKSSQPKKGKIINFFGKADMFY